MHCRAFAARLLYAVREGSQSPLAIDLVIGQGGGETKDRKEETCVAASSNLLERLLFFFPAGLLLMITYSQASGFVR